MTIPTQQIKDALARLGLEPTAVQAVRGPDSRTRVVIITHLPPPGRRAPRDPVETTPQPPPGPQPKKAYVADAQLDDLTAIPGIGKATAAKLAAAGFGSFERLANAPDEALLEFMSKSTLIMVRDLTWTNTM